jgi:4-hydroxyphenylpyruvate dioxygenase-like putative hemolysin
VIPSVLFKKGDTPLDSAVFPFLKNGIIQVGWIVNDIDKAVENFYRLTNIGPWHFYSYGPKMLKIMRRNGIDTEFEMATAVANAGSLRLEMVQPTFGDMVYQKYIDKYGYGGVQHFGIAVENMEESLEIVRKAGVNIAMEGTGYGLDGDGYFAYLDTEDLFGITLELMCRPKRRRDPLKIYPG